MLKIFGNDKVMKWLGRLLGILLAIALFWFITPLRIAFAAPTPPPYTTSWYLDISNPANLSTTLYNMGCTLGTHDYNTAGTQDNVVILLFGKPGYSGSTCSTVFLSTAQIANAVEQFGWGYYKCTLTDTTSQVYVAAGVNNSGSTVGYNHGSAWAAMTNNINSWISANGYSSQVKVRASGDMEMDFNDATSTKDWVNGYSASYGGNSLYLYDVGSAAGCPISGNPTANSPCNNEWVVDDVQYVSWGTTPLYPLPEIYNTAGANASQWYMISLYSYVYKGGPLYFLGSLTEYQACLQMGGCTGINNSPGTGWTQLWNTITADYRTYQSILRWSTDMKWNQLQDQ